MEISRVAALFTLNFVVCESCNKKTSKTRHCQRAGNSRTKTWARATTIVRHYIKEIKFEDRCDLEWTRIQTIPFQHQGGFLWMNAGMGSSFQSERKKRMALNLPHTQLETNLEYFVPFSRTWKDCEADDFCERLIEYMISLNSFNYWTRSVGDRHHVFMRQETPRFTKHFSLINALELVIL